MPKTEMPGEDLLAFKVSAAALMIMVMKVILLSRLISLPP